MRQFRSWFRRLTLDRDLARELDAHLDVHVHHLMARGASLEEARRQARMDLGGVDQVKEQIRDARSGAWLDALGHDARDAFRGLRRTPGITLTASALIALVIGGNTTIYSMVHAVIAKPAPGVRGDGLVTLELRIDGRASGPEHSVPDYVDYASQTKTLVPLMASQFQRFAINVGAGTYAVSGGLVSSNYFETLGVRLLRGRAFTDDDQRSPELVVVIGGGLWQTVFQGAEDVIGQAMVLNGHRATIVGVAPEPFRGEFMPPRAAVWVPLVSYHRLRGTERTLVDRTRARVVEVIGRLAPGASLANARAEFATLSAQLQSLYPATNTGRSVTLVPYSMTAGGDSLVASQSSRFLALFSVITLLTLVIVCANVANLMLGRAVVRHRELALRRTLGASRARIIRTLLMEGFVIAVIAWLAACVLALAVSNGVMHLVSQNAEGLTLDLSPDWQVIGYAFGLAIIGTVAFTMAPAMRAWKQELLPSLRGGEHGVVAGRSTLSTTLVELQLGFAVLLMVSAGLAYRSLSMLSSMDAGFRKENLVLVNIEASEIAASAATRLALVERIRGRLRAVPGINAVSYVLPTDLRPQTVQAEVSSRPLTATSMAVGPDYFTVLGMPLVAGRAFTSGRSIGMPEAIITQHLAAQLWPGQSAVGRTLRVFGRSEPLQVVGVTPNGVFTRYQRETPASYVFRSADDELARPGQGYMSLYVRYAGALDVLTPAIRNAVHEVDASVPVTSLKTMESELSDFADGVRIITIWITLFAVGSLAIAAIGQYAVIAFDMRRRTRDFGVRIALGASSRQIVGAVILQGLRWTATGLLIGFVLSLVAGRALRSLLYGVTPTDGPTYLGVFLMLAAASLLACYLPARRAARVDPIQALRQE